MSGTRPCRTQVSADGKLGPLGCTASSGPLGSPFGQNTRKRSGIRKLRRCRLDEELPSARLLAHLTGLIDQKLLLQVDYLAAEDRILRAQGQARLRLSNAERATLAEIGKRLGRKGLAKVAQVAKPETILGWFRNVYLGNLIDAARPPNLPAHACAMHQAVSLHVGRILLCGWRLGRNHGGHEQLGLP